jgi:hypothetical protein
MQAVIGDECDACTDRLIEWVRGINGAKGMESKKKRREMFVGTRAEPSCRETKVAIVRRSGQSPSGTGGKGRAQVSLLLFLMLPGSP